MLYPAQELNQLIEHCEDLKQVRRKDLQFGDLVGICSSNSVYAIAVLEDNSFSVSGGWFDEQGLSPIKIGINGCTWGGSLLKTDIIAACGMHVEFSNGLVTSPLQAICVLRDGRKEFFAKNDPGAGVPVVMVGRDNLKLRYAAALLQN